MVRRQPCWRWRELGLRPRHAAASPSWRMDRTQGAVAASPLERAGPHVHASHGHAPSAAIHASTHDAPPTAATLQSPAAAAAPRALCWQKSRAQTASSTTSASCAPATHAWCAATATAAKRAPSAQIVAAAGQEAAQEGHSPPLREGDGRSSCEGTPECCRTSGSGGLEG